MRDTSVHQGEIDVKKQKSLKKSILLLSALQAPHSCFGISSEFQALLVQGSAQAAEWSSVHSQYIAVGGSPEYCVMRTTQTIQGFTGFRASVYLQKWSMGFVLVPYLFKAPDFSFPFWKALSNYSFWWSQRRL